MCTLFDNLSLIQNDNLLCPLSNGQGWAMKIKVLSKVIRLSTTSLLGQNIRLLVASHPRSRQAYRVKRARQSDPLTLTTEMPDPSGSQFCLVIQWHALNIPPESPNSTAQDILLGRPSLAPEEKILQDRSIET